MALCCQTNRHLEILKITYLLLFSFVFVYEIFYKHSVSICLEYPSYCVIASHVANRNKGLFRYPWKMIIVRCSINGIGSQTNKNKRKQANPPSVALTENRTLERTVLSADAIWFPLPVPMRANKHSKPSLINDLILIIIQVVAVTVWELSYHQRKHCCFPYWL